VFHINPKVPNMQNKGVNNCTLKLFMIPISNFKIKILIYKIKKRLFKKKISINK